MSFPIISRFDAHARGLKRFYTGVRCVRGHDCQRYTSNGACIECMTFKTPAKSKLNPFAFWPPQAVPFGAAAGGVPSPTEADAVFRAFADWGWQYKILEMLRADPALMSRYDHERTLPEKFAEGR